MASIIPITGQQASQRATKLAKLFAELHEADHAYKAAERARKALLDEVRSSAWSMARSPAPGS